MWNEQLLHYLKNITHQLKFDWNSISDQLKKYNAVNNFLGDEEITAKTCRQQYANEYNTVNNKNPVASTTVDLNSLSLEELIVEVGRKEEEIKNKKELIFQKVLNSLRDPDSTNHTVEPIIHDTATSAFQESIKQRNLEKLKREQLELLQTEKLQLENDRMKLKSRFLPNSIDMQGEDPLATKLRHSTDDVEVEVESLGLNTANVSTSVDETIILFEKFENEEEFDIILSEVEKELDAIAPQKNDA
jgi:hypothetical protein